MRGATIGYTSPDDAVDADALRPWSPAIERVMPTTAPSRSNTACSGWPQAGDGRDVDDRAAAAADHVGIAYLLASMMLLTLTPLPDPTALRRL